MRMNGTYHSSLPLRHMSTMGSLGVMSYECRALGKLYTGEENVLLRRSLGMIKNA